MTPTTYKAFYCYDSKLSLHLKSKGFTCLTVARSKKTDNIFSLYVRDEALDAELYNYNLNLNK